MARIGKTFTLRELGAAIIHFVPLAPRAGLVYGLRRMDPAFREEVMLTVARSNGCRYCSYIHQEWAIQNGSSDQEIAELEGTDPALFDRAKWSALVYARTLAENNFTGVPVEVLDDVAKHYSTGERRNIEAVAAVMTIVNRCANTMEALLSRVRGTGASESLAAEIVITTGMLIVGPPLIPLLSVLLRKSPLRLLRDLRAIAFGEDSEPGAAEAA